MFLLVILVSTSFFQPCLKHTISNFLAFQSSALRSTIKASLTKDTTHLPVNQMAIINARESITSVRTECMTDYPPPILVYSYGTKLSTAYCYYDLNNGQLFDPEEFSERCPSKVRVVLGA